MNNQAYKCQHCDATTNLDYKISDPFKEIFFSPLGALNALDKDKYLCIECLDYRIRFIGGFIIEWTPTLSLAPLPKSNL